MLTWTLSPFTSSSATMILLKALVLSLSTYLREVNKAVRPSPVAHKGTGKGSSGLSPASTPTVRLIATAKKLEFPTQLDARES